MNVNENENFPRGGKRIIPNEPKRKREKSLFNIEKPHKAKKVRREKSSENNANNVNTEELWQASLKLQGTLTYNKLQEGMLILSCVRHISNLALQVEFPGLTFANITINHISDDFTNSLALKLKSANDLCHNGLTNFIKVGQFIPAKVITITKTEKGHEVQATVNPKLVNSNRKHNSFKKGATIWANMVSELDHGYELTVGVNNCRVFLPFKNVDEKKKYDIGEPLYCIIHKVDNSDFATTLTVSAKEEHLGKCQTANLTLDDVIPGMRVDFLIEEISPKGIKGHFFENCFGYIDETQTFSSISPARLKEGKTVPAYVLFVEPITKVTYLTLRGLQNSPDRQLEIGKVLSAKVTSAVSRGLYLELDKTCAGFITNKRLLNSLPKDAQLDIMEAIKKKYPVGSCHDCRILDFNYMEQLYICTFEKQLIKEKVFSVKDLKIGQVVTVTIDKIVPNGLVVKSGHVQGFVPNLHLSNVKYSENIKSKFSVGMSVPARILNITSEENVIFTLKQGLVESEKCLTKMEDAVPGSQYSGFVVQAKVSGALIAFYGDVKGWIRNKVLNAGNPGRYVDPREYFFIGEVVNVWILGLKDNKLQISLNMPNLEKNEKIVEKMKIGEHFGGKITAVHPDRVIIAAGRKKIEAAIPVMHLSSDPVLCTALHKIYKPGDRIKDLMCVNNSGSVPVISRREFIAYKKKSLKVYKLLDLKRNMLLRCSFEEYSDSGIFVTAPIKDYSEKLFIPVNNILCDEKPFTSFKKQQFILTKVLDVNYDSRKVELLVPKDTFNRDINRMIDSLAETIEDIQYIVQLSDQKNAKLVNHKIGERVKCKIRNITAKGAVRVILPYGNGVIPRHLKPANCEIGSVVEGVIIDYNFAKNLCLVSGKNSINQKINKTQDSIINKSLQSSCMAKILYVNKSYAIGILTDSHCNRQLVYLPQYFTEDEKPSYKEKVKVVIYKRVQNKLIAIPKKLLHLLNKAEKKQLKNRKKDVAFSEKEAEINTNEVDDDQIEDEMITDEVDNDQSADEVDNDQSGDELNTDEVDNDQTEDEMNTDEVDNDQSADEMATDEVDDDQTEDEMNTDEIDNDQSADEMNSDEVDNDHISDETNDSPRVENEESEDSSDEADTNENKDSSLNHIQQIQDEKITNKPVLSATAQSFYSVEDKTNDSESSSDDEQENDTRKRKKKMSAAERAEAAKNEEAKIARIEKELADATTAPQTAEQFDRLLVANPNSSELWLRYIAMHVAATELEKARAVGRRAIDTINMTLVKEKFNVWIALLHLENMYGTKQSFEELFEEAVKYNDALDIYLNAIKMFASSEKLLEMEEKIKKLRAKEKQNPKMWLEVGRVYYGLKKCKEARNIKEAAIKSILDKKRQFDLIMRFGIMEFQLGELEHAIANFETILETYPTKVNIWLIYVDQLVKQNKIELARKVLERAVHQTFNVKTMKILFQKFISFEEQHGTPEAIDKVKSRAKEYLTGLGVK